LALAVFCQKTKHYHATAANLYATAFTAQPALADDLAKGRRYAAACSALLAAAGKGKDPHPLIAEARAALTAQVLAWLRVDLEGWTRRCQADQVEVTVLALDWLAHCQRDPELSGVRDAQQLATLAAAEQKAWRQLWSDADRFLKQLGSRFSETTLRGTLTDQQCQQFHTLTRQTYVLDMHSTVLDSYLKLYDDSGKLLAENDDIADNNQDARLIFTPKADGTFRVEATSFEQRGRGGYTLTICAISGAAK
jgi:hypothetical protein